MANKKVIIEEPIEAVEEKAPVKKIKMVVVNVPRLNVRSEASIEAEIIKVVEEGEKLALKAAKAKDGFYSIDLGDSATGYVAKDFVSIEE